jgi:hypothetical protein
MMVRLLDNKEETISPQVERQSKDPCATKIIVFSWMAHGQWQGFSELTFFPQTSLKFVLLHKPVFPLKVT